MNCNNTSEWNKCRYFQIKVGKFPGEGLCPDTCPTDEGTTPHSVGAYILALMALDIRPVRKSCIRHWRSCIFPGQLSIVTAAKFDVQFGRHGVRLVLSENSPSPLAPPCSNLNAFALRWEFTHPKISKQQRAWRWRARLIYINKKGCVSNRNDNSPHLFLIRVPAARPSYSSDTTPAVL